MEEDQETFNNITESPSIVTLTPSFSPCSRRLSSCFSQPRRPIKAARQLAWVSLQGRLVNAEEATSARTVGIGVRGDGGGGGGGGGGLGLKEAVAWELFSPMHRVLLVAVVAAAAANSKKNKQIFQLNKSVELRDQVLSSMQQKLDDLCEQLNYFKDQPEAAMATDTFTCQLCCNRNKHQPDNWMSDTFENMSNGYQVFTTPPPANEPEERRMSDMSDWSSSVASLLDIQLNTEQDMYNLQRECEEKDATIKELTTFLQSSEAFGSKRIVELEEIIRRKNMIINKLKKDIFILEQKVVNLSRLRRPSFSSTKSSARSIPLMTDNLIYDMDSSTSPWSSDTDSSPENTTHAPPDGLVPNGDTVSKRDNNVGRIKGSIYSAKQVDQHKNSRPVSPLREKSLNQTPESVATLRPKHTSSTSGVSGSRRRPPARSRDAIPAKRWA